MQYAWRNVGDSLGQSQAAVELERDPLGLSVGQLRELGYRTVDLLVEQLTDPSIPAMRRADPAELRAKLEQSPTAPQHIVTVRGVGYRFVG